MSPIENPYRKAIRVTQLVTVASVLLLGLGLARAGHPDAFTYAIVGGPLLICCLMGLLILAIVGGWMRRRIRALVEGGYLAHWTYGDMEWRTFTDAEWKLAKGKAKGQPLRVLGIMLVVGVLISLMSSLTLLEGILLGGVIGVPLGILVGIISWWLARMTYRKRSAGPGEVYIGPAGVYQDGYYTALQGIGGSLKGVAIEAGDPQVLKFKMEQRRGPDYDVRIAVPKGKEAEAQDLAARFADGVGGSMGGAAEAKEPVDKELVDWLEGVMAPLNPDQLKFGPGEKVVDVFQRTFREEEQRVRSTEKDPARLEKKLQVLDELRRKFA